MDTVAGELRLPRVKLQRLRLLLHQWGSQRACARRELESLVGLLNHACKVVRSCRSFLRRMIDLLHSRTNATHRGVQTPIRLNRGFRADLAWWQCFMEEWNGTSYQRTPATSHHCTWPLTRLGDGGVELGGQSTGYR